MTSVIRPWLDDGDQRLYAGDCVDVMRGLPEASVDAIVTDPPAGISFMSRSWDHDRGGRDAWVEWLSGVLREALRVAKPGAHALVWSLPRASHWTGSALEDAGWEVRDVVTHLFASGFPKSLDVGKATAPATSDAERWEGWGTALKPAAEFWWLARKPLAAGTVAGNVVEYGTGALNIDASRVGATVETWPGSRGPNTGRAMSDGVMGARSTGDAPAGRWPANVALSHHPDCEPIGETRMVQTDTAVRRHVGKSGGNFPFGAANPDMRDDVSYGEAGREPVEVWRCHVECPVRMLDEQSGELGIISGGRPGKKEAGRFGAFRGLERPVVQYGDIGGASRFFYTAKASRSERNEGLHDLPAASYGEKGQGPLPQQTPSVPRIEKNVHPTVKPVALMRWLVRLVAPPGGVVLDPFCGSGSTLVACRREGVRGWGIERDEGYLRIAAGRLSQLSLLADE